MLCVAASHDPTGYVCVAGRSLGVTDLAILTGASETQVNALFAELERNGVFSRDRTGRIYSRRMVRDARVSAKNRKNGKLGGNPNLSNYRRKSAPVNPPVNPPLKPHKPEASRKVISPKRDINLSMRGPALSLVDSDTPASPDPETQMVDPEEFKAWAAEFAASARRR
jgi:hypothetical protein